MAGSCRKLFGSDAATLYLGSFFGRGTSIRWCARDHCAASVFDVFDRNEVLEAYFRWCGGGRDTNGHKAIVGHPTVLVGPETKRCTEATTTKGQPMKRDFVGDSLVSVTRPGYITLSRPISNEMREGSWSMGREPELRRLWTKQSRCSTEKCGWPGRVAAHRLYARRRELKVKISEGEGYSNPTHGQ